MGVSSFDNVRLCTNDPVFAAPRTVAEPQHRADLELGSITEAQLPAP